MTQKQTIMGRIGQLARANINSLLDRAEDPEKMIDQLVRDYTNSIAEAEEAVAQTIANVRMAESDLKADEEAATEWGNKAAAASRRAEEHRSKDETDAADKFDNLAKVALGRQINYENSVNAARPSIEQQNGQVEQLKDGLRSMKTKLDELKTKRNQLVARARQAEAQNKVQSAMGSINVLDPTSELGRFEDKINREEALAQGRAEASSARFEDAFDELDASDDDTEIAARLAALKSQG